MKIDARFEKMEEHGVSGELEVPGLRIKFRKESKGCFYFGFRGGTLYYHDKQPGEKKPSPKSFSFSKKDLVDIFLFVSDLYELVTSHSIHAVNYIPSKQKYRLE